MKAEDDAIDIKSDSRRYVVGKLFQDARQPDLIKPLDDRELTVPVFQGIVSLALQHGGTLSTEDGKTGTAKSDLQVLIGKRFHLKLTRTIWAILVDCAPLIVSIVVGSPGLVAQTATVGTKIVKTIFSNLERLEPSEWQTYLAIRLLNQQKQSAALPAIHASIAQIAPTSSSPLTEADVSHAVDGLLRKGAIKETANGYQCVT